MLFVSNMTGDLVEITDIGTGKTKQKSREEVLSMASKCPILGVVPAKSTITVVSDVDVYHYLKAKARLSGDFEAKGEAPYCYCRHLGDDYEIMYGQTSIPIDCFRKEHCGKITLPRSILRIGKGAFSFAAVSKIELSDRINYYGEDCFMGTIFNSIDCLCINGSRDFVYRGDNLTICNKANIPISDGSSIHIDCNELRLGVDAFCSRGSNPSVIEMYINCKKLSLDFGIIADEDFTVYTELMQVDILDNLRGLKRAVVSKAVLDEFYFGCYIADVPVVKWRGESLTIGGFADYYPACVGNLINPSKAMFELYSSINPDAKLMRIPKELKLLYLVEGSNLGDDTTLDEFFDRATIMEQSLSCTPLESLALVKDDGTIEELSLEEYYKSIGVE